LNQDAPAIVLIVDIGQQKQGFGDPSQLP